jgi:hypothetical protein
MMHGFEDVTLSWQDKAYTVPANKQLMLIAKIEAALAGENDEQALAVLFRKNGIPHTRLAAAFGAALRYAGAQVTDEEVYLSIHTDIANKSRQEVAAKMQGMLMALLAIISPPSFKAATSAGKEDDTAKKA